MKKFTIPKLLLFFLLTTNFLTAQSYIKAVCKLNNGQSLNGLVKNNFETDDEFIFFKESDQEKKINIKDIENLLIDDKEQYISKIVNFHPNRLLTVNQINDSKITDLELRESKHVLLKTLVVGDINLYQTNIDDRFLYFYSKSNESTLEYLEYYNYKFKDNEIKLNVQFRISLLKNVNCNNHITNSYRYIDYDEKDLIKVVNEHNICVNGTSTVLKNSSDNKNNFRLSAFGGIKMISGNVEYGGGFIPKKTFKDDNISPNFGAEFSYIVNRNRRAEIFTRVDYSTIKFFRSDISDTFMGVTSYEENFEFESSLVGFLIGYRYNFNSLSDTNKGNFGVDFGINSSIPINTNFVFRNRQVGTTEFSEEDISSTLSEVVFGISIGTSYTYLKKYTLEVRYTFKTDYIDHHPSLSAEFSNLNIGFKYLILD